MLKSYEYVNDFLYFVIKPAPNRGEDAFIYCCGVSLSRFLPLTKGRHGLASNPAMRGLQIVKSGVCDLALSKGATPRIIRGKECLGIVPTEEVWYTELLLIENAPESLADEVIDYSVRALLKSIFQACALEAAPPAALLEPKELQWLLETLCTRYGG